MMRGGYAPRGNRVVMVALVGLWLVLLAGVILILMGGTP